MESTRPTHRKDDERIFNFLSAYSVVGVNLLIGTESELMLLDRSGQGKVYQLISRRRFQQMEVLEGQNILITIFFNKIVFFLKKNYDLPLILCPSQFNMFFFLHFCTLLTFHITIRLLFFLFFAIHSIYFAYTFYLINRDKVGKLNIFETNKYFIYF